MEDETSSNTTSNVEARHNNLKKRWGKFVKHDTLNQRLEPYMTRDEVEEMVDRKIDRLIDILKLILPPPN